ncbi:DUF2586 family protein [Algivirga pacifica]|uniref:Phage tail protein n=1 Tax=Algivirga pacifica TaxID=1162670 RepID=A0ABP9D3S1_9BACT
MSTKGVIIGSGKVGASILGDLDRTSALIAHGVAIADNIDLLQTVELYSVNDAEALGLDAEYDSTNAVRVHYHIREFFRFAGEGTKLFLMLVDQSVSLSDMLEDVSSQYAKKLIVDAAGEIRQMAVAYNPAAGYVSTALDGLDDQVVAAIAKAQGLADWAQATFRPINVLLEGYSFNGTAAAAGDLRDLTDLKATHVSVVIGQDYDYAATQDSIGQKHAAVGTALGCVAKVPVNGNIAEVETMNLTDATTGDWLTAGVSSHVTSASMEAEWDTLDLKGYIFPIRYTGLDGVRWNDDHTCTPVEQDAQGNINEHSISLGRTVNKAKRVLRQALLPKVKSTQPVDPNTGKLPMTVIKYFEGIGEQALGRMEANQEIVESRTVVDPNSDLLTPPKELLVDFEVVPFGHIGVIRGAVNLRKAL